MQRLQKSEWQARQSMHQARVDAFIQAHLERRSRSQKHPVWDFLFEYYSFRPAHLSKWSPGIGVELLDADTDFFKWKEVSSHEQIAFLDVAKFPLQRLSGTRETLEILQQTDNRQPQHGCFGLHEWAMVYRAGEVRHSQVALRLSDDEIAHLVESHDVRCSHYDAFRFFTPSAAPLNLLNPSFDTRAEFEQPGCIHANMDLYKWAYKLWPWVSSDLVADALDLARAARLLDMRAAPYDLKEFGVEPIPLETSEGRREYTLYQREIAARAIPIRRRLIASYKDLIERIETANAISN